MTESSNRPPTMREIADVVGPAAKVASEQITKVATAMFEAWSKALDTPSGRALLEIAKRMEADPEFAERVRAANRPRQTCDCLCARWDHLGSCVTDATTTVPISSPVTGLVQVPMCEPCAASVRASATPA